MCVSHSVVSDFFDSMGCSLPISSVHGILQSRIWSKRKESEVTQSCPTLCDPMDCRLPGISVHGIFQARILQWVAISFSRRCSPPRDWSQVSRIIGRRFTVWAIREVKNTEVSCNFHLQRIFLTQGSNLLSPALKADSLSLSHQGSPNMWAIVTAYVIAYVLWQLMW